MIKGDKRIGFRIIRGGIAARGGIGYDKKVLGPAFLECAVGPRVFGHQINPRTFRQPKCRTPFPATARLTGRWMRGRLPTVSDLTRGLPFVHKKVREVAERDIQKKRQAGLETAFCAETVAITLEEMGLLVTEKRSNYFDPGSFWSGDNLPLAPGYSLSREIAVDVPGR
ncbi:adenylate and guanylate cyclase catalytic domain-containing protein [Mycobacteroides abscessus]|nr:adenylate and guanylate cyclase catalytic domain-containing protein [Mycobacteroides abscessus]